MYMQYTVVSTKMLKGNDFDLYEIIENLFHIEGICLIFVNMKQHFVLEHF